jgi:hypothetical protein
MHQAIKMQKMKRNLLKPSIAIIFIISFFYCLYWFFAFEGPLEQLKMGYVNVEKNEDITSACSRIESAINQYGGDWRIAIDIRVMGRKSMSRVGGGGNAIAVWTIIKQFNCECIVMKQEKAILIVDRNRQ